MSRPLRYQLWIAAAACVIFFTNLWATALWDMDEALYTSCAREMFERDNWVVPWFNGEMFPEKPPLMFWTMIAGFELFGVNEFGARFFSAVMGVATALLSFHIGRLLFNERVGFWTGLITATTIIFTISARAATVDSALTFVTTAAMLMFILAKGLGGRGQGSEDEGLAASAASSTTITPLRWPYAALMYAFIGLAVLAKGPVGMVLPLAAIGFFMLFDGGWRRVFYSAWEARPLTAIVVIAAVAVPWYVMVGVQTQGEWVRQFLFEFNLRPFKQPILGHGDAGSLQHIWAAVVSFLYYFYHIPAVLFGFFPWSIFLGPTLLITVQTLRRKSSPLSSLPSPLRTGCLFAVCWFSVWLVFWSVCKTKLPHYLLPAYPALAMLTAYWIDRWLDDKTGSGVFSPYWLRSAWLSAIIAGAGIVVAIPIVAHYYLPGEGIIGLVGLIPIAGGVLCWRLTERGKRRQAMGVYAVASVLLLTAMFGFAAQRVDRHQNAIPMIAAIRADCGTKHPPIATYRFFRESTVYYSGRPVTRCEGDRQGALKELSDFLDSQDLSYVIATDRQQAEIEETFPGRLEVIFRQPRFLAPGEMVVFRCRDSGGDGSTKPDK